MKRLRRWLFNLCAAVSTLMLLAVVTLWGLSWWRVMVFAVSVGGHRVEIENDTDYLLVIIVSGDRGIVQRWVIQTIGPGPIRRGLAEQPYVRLLIPGLGAWADYRQVPNTPYLVEDLFIAYWLLLVLTLPLPLAWLVRYRRGRPKPQGHCHVCGYDLCATLDRCPECGTLSVNEATRAG